MTNTFRYDPSTTELVITTHDDCPVRRYLNNTDLEVTEVPLGSATMFVTKVDDFETIVEDLGAEEEVTPGLNGWCDADPK